MRPRLAIDRPQPKGTSSDLSQLALPLMVSKGAGHDIHDERYVMFFSRKHQGELRVGTDVPITPGRAAALRSPSTPGDLRVAADYQPMTLAFERATLEAEFRAVTGSAKRFVLKLEPGIVDRFRRRSQDPAPRRVHLQRAGS